MKAILITQVGRIGIALLLFTANPAFAGYFQDYVGEKEIDWVVDYYMRQFGRWNSDIVYEILPALRVEKIVGDPEFFKNLRAHRPKISP